jgi:hypothetical protein
MGIGIEICCHPLDVVDVTLPIARLWGFSMVADALALPFRRNFEAPGDLGIISSLR